MADASEFDKAPEKHLSLFETLMRRRSVLGGRSTMLNYVNIYPAVWSGTRCLAKPVNLTDITLH